jgi:type II secretion system protein N
LIGGDIEGILDGTFSLKGKPDSLIDGAVEADLRLTQGRLKVRGAFLNLESIDLAEVVIKASGNLPKLEVNSVKVKGQQFQGSLSGTIRIEDDFEKSDINFKGTLEPFPDFLKSADRTSRALIFVRDRLDKGRLPFVLLGPLMNLQFSFTRG